MNMNHLPRLVKVSSALRHIPLHIASEDKVVLDGIRYSLEIADRAYRRLRETLWKVSRDKKSDHVGRYVDLVSDAWTVVDSLNKLYTLCGSECSYLDHQYCRNYAAALRPIVKLRNSNQHIKGRLEKIVADKESAWGAISWTICATNPPTRGEAHCFVAGTIRNAELSLPVHPERPFFMPVDGITMTADKTDVFISDLMLLTLKFVEQFDISLAKSFPENTPHLRDAHAIGEFSFTGSGLIAPRVTLAVIYEDETPMNRAERRKRHKGRT